MCSIEFVVAAVVVVVSTRLVAPVCVDYTEYGTAFSTREILFQPKYQKFRDGKYKIISNNTYNYWVNGTNLVQLTNCFHENTLDIR